MPVQIFLTGTVRHIPLRTTLAGQPVQVFSLEATGDRYLIAEPVDFPRQPGEQVAVDGWQRLVTVTDQSGLPCTVAVVWSWLCQAAFLPTSQALREMVESIPWPEPF